MTFCTHVCEWPGGGGYTQQVDGAFTRLIIEKHKYNKNIIIIIPSTGHNGESSITKRVPQKAAATK